jgi:hypothetical protein
MTDGQQSPSAEFRFSVRRMLLLMALVSISLAGFRALTEPWSLWLATAMFYLAVVVLFTPRRSGEIHPWPDERP